MIVILLILNYFILKNTYELHQHNMNGTSGNIVFLHVDGHNEAVYDTDGNLVTDPINKASYNYCHPIEKPVCHFIMDTKLWIEFGSGPDDTTTQKERRSAFFKDYADGFKRLIGIID